MPSLKDVKMKIVGVKKTKQITKAMNMVASAKLRGAQQRIERFRPYAAKFYDMLGDLAGKADSAAHPLLEAREEIKTCGIILTSSDRGLCGSFNVNLINAALKLAKRKTAEGKTVKFYCIGKKARDTIQKTDYEVVTGMGDQMNSFDFQLANTIGLEVIDHYLAKKLDEVVLIYGEFVSMAKQVPTVLPILPMVAEAKEEETSGVAKEYIYEPAVEGLLAELLPRFIKVQVYRGLLDTSASEHAARMAAMDNATRSCDDIVGVLTLIYNKTRQASITSDLMDIVSGAEALNG
ncbi:MAG: F0F1 ATP synthase subunit gamma [Pseudomonadota bacterium]